MSAGGGVTNSTSATKDIPKWAMPFFESTVMPTGQSALNQFNAQGGTGGTLNTDAATTIGNEVTGANLNPASNPTQQEVDANAQAQAQQSYAGMEDQIQGQANQSGALFSSGVPAAEADAAQKLATGVAGVTNQADQSWVQQQAGIQAGATGQAQGFNQQSLNDFLQMLNALRGGAANTGTSGYSANITF